MSIFYFGVKYRVLQYVPNENVTFTSLFKTWYKLFQSYLNPFAFSVQRIGFNWRFSLIKTTLNSKYEMGVWVFRYQISCNETWPVQKKNSDKLDYECRYIYIIYIRYKNMQALIAFFLHEDKMQLKYTCTLPWMMQSKWRRRTWCSKRIIYICIMQQFYTFMGINIAINIGT